MEFKIGDKLIVKKGEQTYTLGVNNIFAGQTYIISGVITEGENNCVAVTLKNYTARYGIFRFDKKRGKFHK